MRRSIMYWASNFVFFYDQIQVLITFSLAIFVNIKKILFRDEQHSEKKKQLCRIDNSENSNSK